MTAKNLICVVVDRLHAGMVGAYGNSWIRTRAIDRLACESLVFDQALIDCPRLEPLYRGYWQGVPGHSAEIAPAGGNSLPVRARAAGLHTALVTDEVELWQLRGAVDFDEQIAVAALVGRRHAADAAQTQLASLFDSAAHCLQQAREPFLLWVHARGMSGAWDAPFAYRQGYADQDDPDPPRFADVPNKRLAEDYDPDELLGIVQAYAGQVTLVDECLGEFIAALDAAPAAGNTLLTLLGARGMPLGEHHDVGPRYERLYNELVQVPWLMRFPDGLGRLARSQALVRPADLPGTLLDWLGAEGATAGGGTSLLGIARGEQAALRDRLLMRSDGERAIRTAAWHLRQPDNAPVELYAKPADRWEVNDVSKLLGEVVAGLQAALAAGEPGPGAPAAAPLEAVLVTEVD